MRPSYARKFRPEGVGNAGRPVHPQPRVRIIVENAHEYSQRVHRNSTAFPHAMVLTVSFVLSPAIGSFATVAGRKCFRRLDASVEASGPHDFAVRDQHPRQKRLPRPPHPAPRSWRSRYAPHVGRDEGRYGGDLGRHGTKLFYAMGLDSPDHTKSSPSGCTTSSISSWGG